MILGCEGKHWNGAEVPRKSAFYAEAFPQVFKRLYLHICYSASSGQATGS